MLGDPSRSEEGKREAWQRAKALEIVVEKRGMGSSSVAWGEAG